MRLLEYQRRLVVDPARFVACVKARRVGGSHAAAMRAALRLMGLELMPDGGFRIGPSVPQLVVSASEDQALELLGQVRGHVEALGEAVAMLDVDRKVDTNATSKASVVLRNGVTAKAFACSPRALRGHEGDLTLDEFAFAPNPEALWRAAKACTDRNLGRPEGYRVTVVTTPFAEGSLPHRMCVGSGGDDDAFRRWSRHEITAESAILDYGFPNPEWSREEREAYLAELRDEVDSDTWSLEYDCQWLGSDGLYLPTDLLLAAIFDAHELPRAHDATRFAGADFGRTADRFALVKSLRVPGQGVWFQRSDTLARASFEEQENRIARALNDEGVERAAVDATGIGMAPAERLASRFRGRVESVTFSSALKEDLVTSFRLGLERGDVHLPAGDRELLRDLGRVRRVVSDAGNVLFKSPRDASGHGDTAWAAFLSWKLARMQARSGPGVWTERDFDPAWQPGPSAQLRALNAGIERKNYDDPAAYYRALRNPPRGISRRLRRFV